MIRIAICDDDEIITGKIEIMIMSIASIRAVDVSVDVFFDGSNLYDYIQRGNPFDLIYLDIEMKKLDGIETAKKIRVIDGKVLLIYISNYESYLKDLFEVEPFRFITKPIDIDVFEKYFEKACERIKDCSAYFEFKYNKEMHKVAIGDILYFESNKRIINIITRNATMTFYGKLNDIEKEILKSKQFFLRIHQSMLVNYHFVKKISFSSVELMDGTLLNISAERKKIIRSQYCNFTGGQIID